MPEQWSVGLIPPAEHQVDFGSAAVHLQFQVEVGLSLTFRIATFNPNVQII
tara:strand:- start:66 stop:218 length:153 start_codon:yes stop_codon:yes gene_type:complete